MNHGLPLFLDRGEGRGEESILLAWFIERLFLININFGAAQGSRFSRTVNRTSISDNGR